MKTASVSPKDSTRLVRRLNLNDAVVLGLGSMIGAGVFAAVGPAAAAAGRGVLLGVLIAGLIAYLNATTMAQLAATYPESGGTYVYGRKQLGELWGFLAGWGFIIGKLASCSAMALTFAFYAAPEYARPLAITAVLSLTGINYFGVKKTAFVTKILVLVVLSCLALVVFASLGGGAADTARLSGGLSVDNFAGILQSAGILFFAFAGYARIATLGEEVISPQKNIPRAILVALGITLIIYLAIFITCFLCLDLDTLKSAKAPLVQAVESGSYSYMAPVVRIGACFASLGVLISLMAGISRTTFAMAANGDLPKTLNAVHPTYKVPHRSELVVGITIAFVVSFIDLRSAIGFSSFAILIYYGIANTAAWTLKPEQRRYPKWMSVLGAFFCALVAISLPLISVVGGALLFGLGLLAYSLK